MKNIKKHLKGLFLEEIVKNNGDVLFPLYQTLPKKYEKLETVRPFEYSRLKGGIIDSFKYYNDYIIILGGLFL